MAYRPLLLTEEKDDAEGVIGNGCPRGLRPGQSGEKFLVCRLAGQRRPGR